MRKMWGLRNVDLNFRGNLSNKLMAASLVCVFTYATAVMLIRMFVIKWKKVSLGYMLSSW